VHLHRLSGFKFVKPAQSTIFVQNLKKMDKILIGREPQIQELEEALHSNRPEMIALVGRRRVGKTYLVKQVFKERIDFEITGLQKGNKQDQLQNFVFCVGKYFPNYRFREKPTSWLIAFHQLSQALESLKKEEKKVVFIDELPWLDSNRAGFITGLSWFWNSWAVNEHIVVVICGSAASWMIKKVINDRGGLHNRVTRLLMLYPFTLAETEAYCKYRQINLNRYQILQVYMVMGGVPMYLEQLKSGLSAMQNIQNICFSPSGYLRNEFERLFASLFKNHQQHISVVRALASRRMGLTRQEIIRMTKFSNGGMLTEILDELEKSGFMTLHSGYGKKVKDILYRLADPYSLFYLTFIEPLGKNTVFDFSQFSDLPEWKTWGGYAFENVCLAHITAIRKALSILGVASSVSSFIASPEDGLSGAQIDLLIDRNDQTINLCEIKYSITDFTLTKKDVDNIENKKRVFRHHTGTKKHLFVTLITTMGVVNNAHRLNHIDQVVTLDDLFS
jgi:uncharacterized protein